MQVQLLRYTVSRSLDLRRLTSSAASKASSAPIPSFVSNTTHFDHGPQDPFDRHVLQALSGQTPSLAARDRRFDAGFGETLPFDFGDEEGSVRRPERIGEASTRCHDGFGCVHVKSIKSGIDFPS
ncbi:hypothetical protein KC356_g76 [Hortaea werneckii]|nr:hypothetical protein KC356_g76 [Hortaea werneckii]